MKLKVLLGRKNRICVESGVFTSSSFKREVSLILDILNFVYTQGREVFRSSLRIHSEDLMGVTIIYLFVSVGNTILLKTKILYLPCVGTARQLHIERRGTVDRVSCKRARAATHVLRTLL